VQYTVILFSRGRSDAHKGRKALSKVISLYRVEILMCCTILGFEPKYFNANCQLQTVLEMIDEVLFESG
jgi:hypothetical protein